MQNGISEDILWLQRYHSKWQVILTVTKHDLEELADIGHAAYWN